MQNSGDVSRDLAYLFSEEAFQQPSKAQSSLHAVLLAANKTGALRPRVISQLVSAASRAPLSTIGLLYLRSISVSVRKWGVDSITLPPLVSSMELWCSALGMQRGDSKLKPFAEELSQILETAIPQAPSLFEAGRYALLLGAPVLYVSSASPDLFSSSIYAILFKGFAAKLASCISKGNPRSRDSIMDLDALSHGMCGALPSVLANDLLQVLGIDPPGEGASMTPAFAPNQDFNLVYNMFTLSDNDPSLVPVSEIARTYATCIKSEVPALLADTYGKSRNDPNQYTHAYSQCVSSINPVQRTGAEASSAVSMLT